eukprot:13633642-Alexandrium_andersonii.AAC.1
MLGTGKKAPACVVIDESDSEHTSTSCGRGASSPEHPIIGPGCALLGGDEEMALPHTTSTRTWGQGEGSSCLLGPPGP